MAFVQGGPTYLGAFDVDSVVTGQALGGVQHVHILHRKGAISRYPWHITSEALESATSDAHRAARCESKDDLVV